MDPLPISLDISGLGRSSSGCIFDDPTAVENAKAAFREVIAAKESGSLGFFSLPDNLSLADEAISFARSLAKEIDTLVILGIGGSSLGPQALYRALTLRYQNHPKAGSRRVYFPDNSDPQTLKALLNILDPGKTVFNVITKSGSTAETAAQFLVVHDWLVAHLGQGARGHLVITTDPVAGPMRALAEANSISSFPVPPAVGGRFSVLSAVGIVPAALAGLDVHGLLAGAKKMRDQVIRTSDLSENPALLLASLLHRQDTIDGRKVIVMMPYLDALAPAASWFVQLWAESLGKNERCGPVPIAARGATDQHSQLQLFAEGPDDKVYLFINSKVRSDDIPIPKLNGIEAKEFDYLAGHSMGDLISAQLTGTMASLGARGRPQGVCTLDEVNAEAMGAFFMFLQAATAFAGSLYGVDAFNQPGVEEAKRYAFAGLGRAGYDAEAAHLKTENKSDPRYVF